MLDRVTITGADDSVHPDNLLALSRDFPFVEWGILVSMSRAGSPRYPSADWIRRLQAPRLSMHLCGRFVRALLLGEVMFPLWLLDGFDRVQLNFHAEHLALDSELFRQALRSLGNRQFIFQVDGNCGNAFFEKALMDAEIDAVPLFDVSGGAGVLPEHWPRSVYGRGGFQSGSMLYHGYAGGLGPHNLVEQLPAIAAAAGCRHWVDMETHVRSEDDQTFDVTKVALALRIAGGFISPPDLSSRRS